MKRSAILSAGLILCLTGCTTVRDTLGYAPVIEQQENKHITLKIKEFKDLRTEGEQIAKIRNLYGMPIVKVTTKESIPNWVENALKMELSNAGYTIANSYGSEDYRIEGQVIKMFADGYFSYDACLVLNIALKKEDQVIFQKTYEATHDGQVEDSEGKKQSFEYATFTERFKYDLQDICKHFIADINQHLLKSSNHTLKDALPKIDKSPDTSS